MVTYDEFKKAQEIVEKYMEQRLKRATYFKELKKEIEEKGVSKFTYVNKEMSINDTFTSIRLTNILRANSDMQSGYWDMKIKDLENISMTQFLRYRGAGKEMLRELKELCSYAGVSLKP